MIIACDFDDTLYREATEQINLPLIDKLKEAKEKGHKLILWTCRGDEWLVEAVDLCKSWGLNFDAINENVKGYNYTRISCKVVADYYIDDKSPGSIENFIKMEL